ncbi:MAG: thiamine phosphate synthase, partial [Deltaproteobacteria bacterium]
MRKIPFEKDIYAISDDVTLLKEAIEQGAKIVQLRDKNADKESIIEKSHKLLMLKKNTDFIFILNDEPEIAVAVGADGVHIGQDYDTKQARKTIGDDAILGKTTHGIEQAMLAVNEGADYVSAGPVFATPTKPDRKPTTLNYVTQITRANLPIPFVAIGGIDLSNIDIVLGAGAKTVGIVRA